MLQKIFLLIILIPLLGFGQKSNNVNQKKINTLEKELTDAKDKGSIQLKLAELYWKISPKKSINYGKQAIHYFETKHSKKLPDALINTAIGFYYIGQLDSTVYYTEKILKLDKQLLTNNKLGVSYNLLCVANKNLNNYDGALKYGKLALEKFKQTNDSTRLPGTLDNIASIYKKTGDYKQSLQFSLQSLRAFEHNKDTLGIASTQMNIANLYGYLKNEEKNKTYLKKAAQLAKELKDDYFLADIYNNLGVLFSDAKKNDSAYYFFNKALNFYKKANINSGIAVTTQNIGMVYIHKKQYNKGIPYLKDAINKFEAIHSKEDLADTYRDLGATYTKISKYNLAKHYLNLSLKLSQKIANLRLQLKALNQLELLHYKTNDYKKAYHFKELSYTLKDSISSTEIYKQLAELDKKYQTEKKEKEIERLASQEKIQKAKNNTLFIILLSLISFVMLSAAFIWQRRKKEKAIAQLKLKKTQLKQQQLEQELEYKNKRLATHAINIMQRNKLLQNYLNILKNIEPKDEAKTQTQYNSLKREIHKTIQSKKDWDNFKTYFEETNKSFVDTLIKHNPDLTNNDFRLAALIRLGMTNKEIASIFNISTQSVKNALYRLKKKMKLNESENLRTFLKKL